MCECFERGDNTAHVDECCYQEWVEFQRQRVLAAPRQRDCCDGFGMQWSGGRKVVVSAETAAHVNYKQGHLLVMPCGNCGRGPDAPAQPIEKVEELDEEPLLGRPSVYKLPWCDRIANCAGAEPHRRGPTCAVKREQNIIDLVKTDLDARERKGIETYGAPLTTETEIDPLWYAYEELLDLVMYLRMLIERGRLQSPHGDPGTTPETKR